MKWVSFLIGLAIGLWIALVALFLRPIHEQQPISLTVNGMAQTQGAGLHAKVLWIPSGNDLYRCTNNDQGGALVEDQGGGVVEDHGAAIVDDHGAAIVDDHGAAIVEDNGGGNAVENAAHVPAPSSAQQSPERGYRELRCNLNKYGGPVVKHDYGRVVAVGMPLGGDYVCLSESGNATVRRADGVRIDIGADGTINVDSGDINTDTSESVSLPGSEPGGSDLVYCMVAGSDSGPVIVDVDGIILSSGNP